MRLLSAVLFVALTGSIGFAEDTAPPPAPADTAKPAEAKPRGTRTKVPLRVVKLLPETGQVLLFDKTKGTHVVAEVGQDVDGYVVDEIGDDDVTLVAQNGTEVILAAPEPAWRRRADRKATATGAPVVTADPTKAEPSKADPTKADPTMTDLAPEDPYADAPPTAPVAPGADGVRVASATPTSDVDPGVAAFMAAVAGDDVAAPKPAVAAPAVAAPAVAAPAVAAPAVAAPAAAGPTTATIKRAEIDAALADFATTASTFHASFTKDGLRFDDVAKGSLLARTGLERGDVVTTVDGQPLRSLDDAANLYARLPTARGTTLQVLRSGKPVTLRVSIQ